MGLTNMLINPLTVGVSLTLVGGAGLVGGFFSGVLDRTFMGIKLSQILSVVPFAIGLSILAGNYLGMDLPLVGDFTSAVHEAEMNWEEDSNAYGQDSAGISGQGVPQWYGSAEWY